MTPSELSALVAGLLTAGFLVCGLFFLRFWARTHDRLFLAFAIAFWLIAANQAAPVVMGLDREDAAGVYLLRLGAFLLIIVAVLSKNLRRRSSLGRR